MDDEDGHRSAPLTCSALIWRAACELELPGSEWVLDEWSDTLDALARGSFAVWPTVWTGWPRKLCSTSSPKPKDLDWKRDALTLQSLDLAYHNVDPEPRLYYGLVESGAMVTLVERGRDRSRALPRRRDTRAALRGLLVRRFAQRPSKLFRGAA